EAETVEKLAQARVVAAPEAFVFAEGIGNPRQRLVEEGAHLLLLRHVAGHLAQPVHVVGEADEAGRYAILGKQPEGRAHHRRARHLAERTDMGHARWTVSRLEDDLVARLPPNPLNNLARFL